MLPGNCRRPEGCEHACCKKAGEEGKICKKCHKQEKKEEAK